MHGLWIGDRDLAPDRRVALAASADAANPFESCMRAIALTVPGLRVVPVRRVR